MHGEPLEICGPQIWPDNPTEEYLMLLICSPRFRLGLLVWYVQDDKLWKELSEELGGSFPMSWLLTSMPSTYRADPGAQMAALLKFMEIQQQRNALSGHTLYADNGS